MAKSPLSIGSKKANPVINSKNVIPLGYTIPHRYLSDKQNNDMDISHLLYQGRDKNNKKIESRSNYLKSFCKKANDHVSNGKSVKSVASFYEVFSAYIGFCDGIPVNPFEEAGYLKYAGNDGLLRHRIKIYEPSIKLWERQHGDELGIRETTASTHASQLRTALSWCGLPTDVWQNQHSGFAGIKTPFKSYSDAEEKLLITRLSELFFTLAPQLIAAKESNSTLPDELQVTIDLGESQEIISFPTSLKTNLGIKNKEGTSVKSNAAFNITMGAAYHLMCFFTSLNDSDIRSIAHPITIHTDERDKSLQTIKVSSFKVRANKRVDSLFTNDIDESFAQFDVDKRDGVNFIKVVEKLSNLYGNNKEDPELLFSLNAKGEQAKSFRIKTINTPLIASLNLLSPNRVSCLPWFKELFYAYRNNECIELKITTNELARTKVSKVTTPINVKARATQGLKNTSYCILSCYTNLSLKGILLPLSYSEKNSDGNITISFKYRNDNVGSFTIPAVDKQLIQDIEQFATVQADNQTVKKHIRLLLKNGGSKEAARDWEGISPISFNRITQWSITPGEYFISLQSSRWRETTSSQEYDDSNIGRVQSILQNSLETIDRHYSNGDPRLNQTILSQGIQVIEQIPKSSTLNGAKEYIAAKHAIPMIAHDKCLKKKKENKAKTNPNGIACNGQQKIENATNSQRETNNAIGEKLPCAEFDMCYKCKSARAVDDVQAIYKLISFIDALKEVLDQLPTAKKEVFEKIDAYENTLDGASTSIYEDAMALFNENGRHPRVSNDHAILSIYRKPGD